MHTKSVIPTGRVFIIGAGQVGSAAAYALLNQNVTREIVLIDIDSELAQSQALDLAHASANFSGIKISAGSYDMLRDGDFIVITSGAAQKEGMTRMDLANVNIKIMRSVLAEIKKQKKDNFIMLVSNPVDVLTHIAITEMDYLPAGRVFGSGTTLDSARFSHILAKELKINPTDIISHVLGEHGDSSFPAVSLSSVHGIHLPNLIEITDEKITNWQTQVRESAYRIIDGKGATNYGIGGAISLFVRRIFENSRIIRPASVKLDGQYGLSDISISVPAMVDMEGVIAAEEVKLTDQELNKLQKSAHIIKQKIAEINSQANTELKSEVNS